MYKFNINTQETDEVVQPIIAAIIILLPDDVIANLNGSLSEAPYGVFIELTWVKGKMQVNLNLYSQRDTLGRYTFLNNDGYMTIEQYEKILKRLGLDEKIAACYQQQPDWIYAVPLKRKTSKRGSVRSL